MESFKTLVLIQVIDKATAASQTGGTVLLMGTPRVLSGYLKTA
jgi:hypothetical protein